MPPGSLVHSFFVVISSQTLSLILLLSVGNGVGGGGASVGNGVGGVAGVGIDGSVGNCVMGWEC